MRTVAAVTLGLLVILSAVSSSAVNPKPMDYAVAISGDYAVVGAPWHDNFKGAAYVLKRDNGGWVQVQKLSPDDLGSYDHFGGSVSIDAGRILVGSSWHDLFRGAAYVFAIEGDTWRLRQKLMAADARPDGRFGRVVNVAGDGIVIGTGAQEYRFERSDNRWVERERVAATTLEESASRLDASSAAAADILQAAERAFGESQPAAPSAAAPPAPIDTLLATNGAFETRVVLSWPSVGLDAIVYLIKRDGTLIAVASSQETSYIDLTGTLNQTYNYCVAVKDMADQVSADSCATGRRILFAPQNTAATDGGFVDKVRITWDDISNINTGYRLYRDSVLIDSLGANASFYDDIGATIPTSLPLIYHDYDVVAYKGIFVSVAGQDSGAVALIRPPKSVSASDGTYIDRIRITWQGQSPDTLAYKIRKNGLVIASSVPGGPSGSYDDMNFAFNEHYEYCVTTMNVDSLESFTACDSGFVGLEAPGNVTASDSTFDDGIQITWQDRSQFEDGYEISMLVAGPDTVVIATTGANVNTYKHSAVTPDSIETYFVRAFSNGGGFSDYRSDTGKRAYVIPPINVQASDGEFEDHTQITWESNSTTVNLFKIYRDGVFIKSMQKSIRSYDDAGGTAGQSYDYTVRAVTVGGGAEREATSVADAGRRELLAPTSVAASDDEFEDRVEITWTDNATLEGGYNVYRVPLTPPFNPTFLGTYDTPGNANGVAVSGGVAYVADGFSGLVMIDVSTPSAPTLLGTYDTPGNANGVAVSGGIAYVADGSSGLVMIDVSTPSAPTLLGTYDTLGVANGVAVSGGVAYVASGMGGGLVMIDVSTPLTPTFLGAYDTPGQAKGIFVSGSVAYVADGSSGLVMIDVSTPSAPTLLGTYASGGFVSEVFVSDGVAYVADQGWGLEVIDVGTPSAPNPLGWYQTASGGLGIFVSGSVAYVADAASGLVMIDVSTLSAPTLLGTYDTPGSAWGVVVTGGVAYVADYDAGLQILDDPFDGVLIGSTGANGASFVDTGGAPAATYSYKVAAFDDLGETRGESARGADNGRRVLLAPTAVSATDGEFEDHVEITWVENSAAEDGYVIYRNGTPIDSTADNFTSFIDTSPMLGTRVEYSVRAFDALGTSAADVDSGFTTVLAPISVNASDTYEVSVLVKWVDASKFEAGYRIQIDDNAPINLPANTTSYPHTTGDNVTHTYCVWAYTGSTESDKVCDTGITPALLTGIPTSQIGNRLIPSPDSEAYTFVGYRVATDGNYAIVGGPSAGVGTKGEAYIFERAGDGTWSLQQTLTASVGATNDKFGEAVAIDVSVSGAYAVVDANRTDRSSQTDAGSVYVFKFNTLTKLWEQINEVMAPSPEAQGYFGTSVGISYPYMIVGSPYAGASDQGRVDWYEHNGSSWVLKSSEASVAANRRLGLGVAISGNRSVSCYTDIAQVNFWRRVNSTGLWVFETGKTGTIGKDFGASIAMDDSSVAIVGGRLNGGQVKIYERTGTSWSSGEDITVVQNKNFGASVDIKNGRAVVGAITDGLDGNNTGAAYYFEKGATSWLPAKLKLVSTEGGSGQQFGYSVALGDSDIVVGTPFDNHNGTQSGRVYSMSLFPVPPANVKASDGTFANRVNVQWEDHSAVEDGFNIYKDGSLLATVGPNVEVYADVEAVPGRAYSYCVTSFSSVWGGESEQVCDFGRRVPNGSITGRVASREDAGVEGVSVCLTPPATRALLLDGAGGLVSVADNDAFDFQETSSFTLECWFRTPDLTATAILIEKGIITSPDFYALAIAANGVFICQISTSAVNSGVSGLDDDTWHHVATVYNGSTKVLQLYIDGAASGAPNSGAGVGDFSSNEDLVFGGTTGTEYGGQLDEIRIWGTARTPAQIVANMSRQLTGSEPGLLGYWPMDDGAGAVATELVNDNYGALTGGAYWTSDVAVLDECATTDLEGNYMFKGLRYGDGTEVFKVRPSLGQDQFSPVNQQAAISEQSPVQNKVDFSDISEFTISGRIQFAGTSCFERDVEIFVDNESATRSDKNGKFSVSVPKGGHTIEPRLEGHVFSPVDTTRNVDADIADIVFVNLTTRTLSGLVGGGCSRYVGDITIRLRTASSCIDTTFAADTTSTPDGYTITLPPQKYIGSASVDLGTIPAGLNKADVVKFFEDLGEREVDLTSADATLDFIYRAPLVITFSGLDTFVGACQLTFNGANLPPNLPMIPQNMLIPLQIEVSEDYGISGLCPLDSGTVVIYDEIADRQDEPIAVPVRFGIATYTSLANTPSLIRGRTDGSNDRSFQKPITAVVTLDGRDPASHTEWALITGHVAPEGAEFISVASTDMPLFILRDPPGDKSYAFIEENMEVCNTIDWKASFDTELKGPVVEGIYGPQFDVTLNFWLANTAFHFAAAKVKEERKLDGDRTMSETKLQICMTTTERFSTSPEAKWIGEHGDVFVGAGFNFLFAKVGVIDVVGCEVKQSIAVGFQPDSLATTFVYTERHITEVLIPELEFQAANSLETDPLASANFELRRDKWQEILDNNRALKDAATVERNISFSAGANFEHVFQQDTTTAVSTSVYLISETEEVDGWLGAAAVVERRSIDVTQKQSGNLSDFEEGENTHALAVGYVLSDDDDGDNFTVDVKNDGAYWSPVFDVLGGQSSCPYEAWRDSDDVARMVARDMPKIDVFPPTLSGADPDKPAVLKLLVKNESLDQTRDFRVRSLSNSNPGGAIIKVNGSPVEDGLVFTVDHFQSPNGNVHEATLTVERGPTRFNYNTLQLVVEPVCNDLRTTGWATVISDTVTFSVSFQGCSEIALTFPEPGWSYNAANQAANLKLPLTLEDYELIITPFNPFTLVPADSLDAVGVEYRRLGVDREGPGPWMTELGLSDTDSIDADLTVIDWQPPVALEDGVYELRAYTACNGANSDFRGYSDVVTGTIDRHPPEVFGTPEPADEQLSLGEDIRIGFDEPIRCSSVDTSSIHLTYLDGPDAWDRIKIKTTCNGNTVIIAPLDPADLTEGSRLRVVVTGITDLSGNPMAVAPVTWEFVVGTRLFTWSQTSLNAEVPLGSAQVITAELVNGTQNSVTYTIPDSSLAWLTVDPSADSTGTLAPGGKRTVGFLVDAALPVGLYHDRAYALDATQGSAELDVHLTVVCREPAWVIDPSDFEYNMTMTVEVTTDSLLGPSTDPNDRLAAFVGNEMRGVANLQSAGGGYLAFLTVHSNQQSDESVRFEVWDADLCRHYTSTDTLFDFLDNWNYGTIAAPVQMTASMSPPNVTGVFELTSGWNWFSTNVVSPSMTVTSVLASMAPSDGDIIKSLDSCAVYDPVAGWVGMSQIDNAASYMIRLAEPATVVHNGVAVNPGDVGISYNSQWNWIGYTPKVVMSVDSALVGFSATSGDIVRGQNVFSEYDAAGPPYWTGSLARMEPGEGYRLYTTGAPGMFVYPDPGPVSTGVLITTGTAVRAGGTSQTPGIPGLSTWTFEPGRYEHTMTVIALLRANGTEWRDYKDMIAAFVDGECRGIARLTYVPAIDRYVALIMIHGDKTNGEIVTFQMYDDHGAVLYDVAEKVTYAADTVKGSIRSPQAMNATAAINSDLPMSFRLLQNYPNPFNPATVIAYDVPAGGGKVTLRIHDVSGRLVRTLVNRVEAPGRKTVTWSGKNNKGQSVATGVYFYSMKAPGFRQTRKMLLLK